MWKHGSQKFSKTIYYFNDKHLYIPFKMKVFFCVLLYFVSIFLLLSCSNKLNEDGPSAIGKVRLTVEVEGIKELTADVPHAKLQSFAKAKNRLREGKAIARPLSSEIFVQTVADEKLLATGAPMSLNHTRKNTVNLQSKQHNRARQAMMHGMKYRILLYEKENGRFYRSYVGMAGVKQEIDLVRDKEYSWIAYSYNNAKDLPLPSNTASPTINTPTDTEFLYASGTISALQQEVPLVITFAHKLAKISLSINTEGMYADIVQVRGMLESADYVRSGTLDLRTGNVENLVSISKNEIYFKDADPDLKYLKIATFYTADPSKLGSITIKVSSLSVRYFNGTIDEVVTDSAPLVSSFGSYNPDIGKEAIANLNLWKVLRPKKMVHVGRIAGFGYSAGDMASYNLLANFRNFGSGTGSFVKMRPFTHVVVNAHGGLLQQLNAIDKPDIVLLAVYYTMSRAEIAALVDYTRAGGVVLIFTDNAGGSAEYNAHLEYLRAIFNMPTIQRTAAGSGGYVYTLASHNDMILNGPFGDVRSRAWGEDASATSSLQGLPTNDVTIYSNASAVNSTTGRTGVTMFRHNSLNVFWAGDGGFLSNTAARGTVASAVAFPFATDQHDFPVKKGSYGIAGNGIAGSSLDVYNSIVFANVMAWAVVRAEFFGIQ